MREPLSIWFLVGAMLLVYGVIVIAGGFVAPSHPTVLAELRPSLWWGAMMVVAGGVFLVANRR